jgi:hypothetical protein
VWRFKKGSDGFVSSTRSKAKAMFVDLAAAPPLSEAQFWWWLIRRSGGLIAGVPARVLLSSDLFCHADYPEIITNLGAVIDRTAIKFARESAKANRIVCLCPDKHNGIQLQIFAEPGIALNLFDRAVDAPRPNWVFPKPYSRYWVLTFEQKSALRFLFEAEEKRNMEFLCLALKSAVSNPHHRATVLRALAAAEILAAAHGKPAAQYNGHRDRSIDRSVLRLAKKLTRPSPKTLKVAREIVAVIADHSKAPKEIWLSEEARALWRQRQIDLHARLK